MGLLLPAPDGQQAAAVSGAGRAVVGCQGSLPWLRVCGSAAVPAACSLTASRRLPWRRLWGLWLKGLWAGCAALGVWSSAQACP
jgi:hypothetical protein